MIRHEHRRLSHLFGLLLAAGCTTREMPIDATVPTDTSAIDTAMMDLDATIQPDAGEDVFCGVGVALRLDGDIGDVDAEADPGCEYTFPCGLPDGTIIVGCELFAPGQGPLDARAFGCSIREGRGCTDGQVAPADGSVVVDCADCLGGAGRGSEGVEKLERVRARSAFAGWLGKMAHDEAASVWAFERFARELRAHGAPRSLVRAALRAKADEIRHARTMRAHAKRFGAKVRPPVIRKSKSKRARELEAVAIENAVEGCVNETFGALALAIQARAVMMAPELRSPLARIARDELRHAALARAAARWLDARLSPDARARVAAAKDAAIAALVAKPSVVEIGRALRGGLPALADVLAA